MSARSLVLFVAFAITCEAAIPFRDPVYRETALRHERPRVAGEKFDPQESDPKLREAFAAADAAAEHRVANVTRDGRFIFRFWSAKKEILRQKYGIDWRSPAELSPTLVYDWYGRPRVSGREIRAITPIVHRHLRNPPEKIISFERTFKGTVEVTTRIGESEDQGRYELRGRDDHWRLIDYHLMQP
jgi:hypothetical protein